MPGDPGPQDPRVGEILADRYRLTGKIGRGGMGAIYEAVHLVTGKHFAVKTLLPGLGRVGEIARRFEREAHAGGRLAHPNIVSVVDFGALPDDSLFLAMELVGGRPLSDVIDEGPLAPGRALAIVRQVLEALGHAHAAGVVHRDLKPDNIMLVDAGDSAEERDLVKLLDFGIAKLAGPAGAASPGEPLTEAGVAFGTPDYMAPEQALAEEVDARADLYSLGVIAFELLTGARPFPSDDKMAVLRMHVAVAAPALDGSRFAPEVQRLIARALEKRRDDRFAGAGEMTAALDAAVAAQAAFQAGDAPTPTPTPTPAPAPIPTGTAPLLLTPPPARGVGWLGPGAMVVVVAVLALLGVRAACTGSPRSAQPPLSALPGLPRADVAASFSGDTWLVLAHARAEAGQDGEALSLIERALTHAPSPSLRPLLEADLRKVSRGRSASGRARARELAGGAGITLDLVASYGADLERGASCRERHEAIPHLRALGDKRAIPLLRRARGRTGGFLGLASVNDCLAADAAEAADFLGALP